MFIKKIYKDNPLFANSKVVYSAYNDGFKTPLNKEIITKIEEDGIPKKDISILSDPTFVNLSKLAVDYSDATIKGSETINEEVENYMKSSGKLFLDHQPADTYIDAYSEFYDKIL